MEPGASACRDGTTSAKERMECIICLETGAFDGNGLELGELKPIHAWLHGAEGCACTDVAHWACLQPWVAAHRECPVCRRGMRLNHAESAAAPAVHRSRVYPVLPELRPPLIQARGPFAIGMPDARDAPRFIVPVGSGVWIHDRCPDRHLASWSSDSESSRGSELDARPPEHPLPMREMSADRAFGSIIRLAGAIFFAGLIIIVVVALL